MAPGTQQLQARLHTLKRGLAGQFRDTHERLLGACSEALVEEWVEICSDLTFAGWHTWQSTQAYIEISEPLLERGGGLLVECGRYGVQLSAISHEPATAYFRGLASLIERDALASRLHWQRTAELIAERFPRPSSVLAQYLSAAGDLSRVQSPSELGHWIDLAARFAATDANDIRRFLTLSRDNLASPISWHYGKRLHDISPDVLVELLECYPAIAAALDAGAIPRVEQLLLRMAPDGEAAVAFLEALVDNPASESRETMSRLLARCVALAEVAPGLVNAFLDNFSRLPVLSAEQFDQWFEEGLALARGNVAAGEAYFAVESATSTDLLSDLSGKVYFADLRRVFELYSEGICGMPMKLEELPETERSGPLLPGSDGERVYLPPVVSEFDSVARNMALYRLSLLHQLGFYEEGTFRFRTGEEGSFTAFFAGFEDESLARTLFRHLEDGRIDHHLMARYRGVAPELRWLMADVLAGRPPVTALQERGWPAQTLLLEALLQMTLGARDLRLEGLAEELRFLQQEVDRIAHDGTTVADTIACVERCYALLHVPGMDHVPGLELPEVFYRGRIDPEQIAARMEAVLADEVLLDLEERDKKQMLADLIDRSKIKITKLVRGDVRSAMGVMLTDIEKQLVEGELDEEELDKQIDQIKGLVHENRGLEPTAPKVFYYDEWDYLISDYRRRWCRLFEITVEGSDEEFVQRALLQHKALLLQIRRQLQMLKPGQQRKVKGQQDGEEIDLERSVELVTDRRSGVSADDRIYVQRLRRERDVAALFLLDMSASTDDRIRTGEEDEAAPPPAIDDPPRYRDEFLEAFYGPPRRRGPEPPRRRIIDVEKESVALMAEALQDLGDSYAICGFSGYGRDQVDYYVCKDFNERYDDEVRGRLGAIKPCRSTRMGPAIRHAVARLDHTDARIKALIIISDGYPQDHDYGEDRTEREYGVQDTTKALGEARQKGIQAFCLTVDPSGHDYLREMCRDQHYMVIQDINQLPNELSKVYRGLTA